MENICTELLQRLKIRFDSCYDEYVVEVLARSNEGIFEAASEIVAFKEVYYEMRFWIELSMSSSWPNTIIKEPLGKEDTATLLAFNNPLRELALKWWFHKLGCSADFYEFFKAQKQDTGGVFNARQT
jgi:hypothetical protein